MIHIMNNKIEDDILISQDAAFYGMITGNAKIREGVSFKLYGMVCKNIYVPKDAIVHVYGTVIGDVINNGGRINMALLEIEWVAI
jgi:hypothetical protein